MSIAADRQLGRINIPDDRRGRTAGPRRSWASTEPYVPRGTAFNAPAARATSLPWSVASVRYLRVAVLTDGFAAWTLAIASRIGAILSFAFVGSVPTQGSSMVGTGGRSASTSSDGCLPTPVGGASLSPGLAEQPPASGSVHSPVTAVASRAALGARSGSFAGSVMPVSVLTTVVVSPPVRATPTTWVVTGSAQPPPREPDRALSPVVVADVVNRTGVVWWADGTLHLAGAALAISLPRRADSAAGEQISRMSATRPRNNRLRNVGPVVVTGLRANATLRAFSGFLTLYLAFLLRTHPLQPLAVNAVIGLAASAAPARA